MNIITISREFGSGGRELGKRLADLLGYDYYDREIITAKARKNCVIVGRNADILLLPHAGLGGNYAHSAFRPF